MKTFYAGNDLRGVSYLMRIVSRKYCETKLTLSRWHSRLVLLLLFPIFAVSDADLVSFERQLLSRYGSNAAYIAGEFRVMLGEQASSPVAKKLDVVNHFFNSRIRFRDDQQTWGKKDFWASPGETIGRGAGDCEDFTIVKYVALKLLGIPEEKLRLTYVKAQLSSVAGVPSQAHMVLTYYETPGSVPLVLDNLRAEVLPASLRQDLKPVFGFNSKGLWVGSRTGSTGHDPLTRVSRWREVLRKISSEGLD
jgi:predicted transglutaminase-like cysteine proteinase